MVHKMPLAIKLLHEYGYAMIIIGLSGDSYGTKDEF